MLRLEMLPAGCGDCIWLECGTGLDSSIVLIDGGIRDTVAPIRARIAKAQKERRVDILDVQLLVITHIDNDHLLGIVELLKTKDLPVRFLDMWFNGRPQLLRLPPESADRGRARRRSKPSPARPGDLLGSNDDGYEPRPLPSAQDLLGPAQSDELSALLASRGFRCNQNKIWPGEIVMIPDEGPLPSTTLPGDLRLTVLGPSIDRLRTLCEAWPDVLAGKDEPSGQAPASDILGQRDSWPPVWKDDEQRDSSDANASSIVLLAEHGSHSILLAGDAHAPDLSAAVGRLCSARGASAGSLRLSAFKVSHHGSTRNLTDPLLDKISCERYLISTNGSGRSAHPDQQALLRILRHSPGSPQLVFNYDVPTTRPWWTRMDEVRGAKYTTHHPTAPAEGVVVTLD